ncbi:MBL fold metallo-hydrolase [Fulvivirga sp.]|uniref:ComEC/Rec2 family competence protein n=1 Tax=Fulvivirga sp. TaxID=1931237 RepID=UPI0032ED34C9
MQERGFPVGNLAKEKLIPDEGVLRCAHLYVGQGESTLFVIPNGSNFIFVLLDCNVDRKNRGIDLVKLLKDLLDDGDELIFINTHPHNDHLIGLKKLHDEIGFKEVWHSGHKPGKKHEGAYEELKYVIEQIGDENEFVLCGSNSDNTVRTSDKETSIIKKLGDIDYQVLSPAEYVSDDVDGEDDDTRYNRIHEMSGVIKFKYGVNLKSILHTGDSDKKAWQDHITDYHSNSLGSEVLSASHHGSRSFFKNDKDDQEPYEDHMDKIEPEYLVISAPKQSESQFDHPHDDAIELYKKYVNDENIYHLGDDRHSLFVDITSDGEISIEKDFDLVKSYSLSENEDDDPDDSEKNQKLKAAMIMAERAVSPKPYFNGDVS